jgi:hypothetical protein
MTATPNSLHPKPDYCLHRDIQSQEFDPAVIVADTTNLTNLFSDADARNDRASISCKGWKSVDFLIVIEGGASPTVDIQPLEHVKADDAFTTPTDEGFVVLASTIAGIVSGDINEVVVDQGRLFLRLHAVANAPTDVRMYIIGKERAISTTGQS